MWLLLVWWWFLVVVQWLIILKIIMIVREADLSENCFANLSVKCVFLLHIQ